MQIVVKQCLWNILSQFDTSLISSSYCCILGGSYVGRQSYMVIGDWLNTSHDSLSGSLYVMEDVD